VNALEAGLEPPSRVRLPAGIWARLDGRPMRYLLAGAWNTVFGVSCSFLLYWLLHERLHYIIIVVIGNILAITMAFATHKFFVYRTRGHILVEYLRFYLVYGFAIAFGLIATPFCVEVLGLNFYVSQLLILGATVATSYFGHQRFTFARNAGGGADGG